MLAVAALAKRFTRVVRYNTRAIPYLSLTSSLHRSVRDHMQVMKLTTLHPKPLVDPT
jgi:hypothetical protein